MISAGRSLSGHAAAAPDLSLDIARAEAELPAGNLLDIARPECAVATLLDIARAEAELSAAAGGLKPGQNCAAASLARVARQSRALCRLIFFFIVKTEIIAERTLCNKPLAVYYNKHL